MSRHTLRCDDTYEVVVGYDSPLDSYFVQVYDVLEGKAADDDVLIVWRGTDPNEITDPREALAHLKEYVDASAEEWESLAQVLEGERTNRQMPTEFQRETFRRMTGRELP